MSLFFGIVKSGICASVVCTYQLVHLIDEGTDNIIIGVCRRVSTKVSKESVIRTRGTDLAI